MSQSGWKIVVLGCSGVGKTAIVQRFVENRFTEDGTSTVGVEFKAHTVNTGEGPIKLNIWDTAGQERFKSVSRAYFRNAVGAILVFAIDQKSSFTELDTWLDDLHKLAAPNASVILVGNKCDLTAERQVSDSEVREYATRHGLQYLEASAKTANNINETFVRLALSINERVKSGAIAGLAESPTIPPIIGSQSNRNEKGSGCC